ncbi:MAG: two-component sensor histidine kinase, partial [Acidobacteria bacterium]|nr:two-component sensor histidine kinase [Acidobacteriota bacterium]
TLREACAQGQTLAQAKHVAFDCQYPDTNLLIQGDPQALRRLFLILIDNAVKYTASGGRVSVSLKGADGFAIGEVRDSGIGVSPDDLPNIFERFYRADKARSREQGGAGLGLSIAQWIADAHGAAIEVDSTPGKGSVFRVRIPILGSS